MRGNRGQTIFRDDRDSSFFMRELEATARRYHWTWLAYCLMSNHCHLVLETPERTLGLGMRRFAGRYAQRFNLRHDTYGHLCQERYGSVLVESEVHFAQLLRYVALNPVSAGLCTDPAEWRWSSHRDMLNGNPAAARARERVESLLEAWGRPHGERYASLFDPDGALART
jgi:putative transposase